MTGSAAAIRVADHLREPLFRYVFDQGLSVRRAVEELHTDRRVHIPVEVAEALIREEQVRRQIQEDRKDTRRLVDTAHQLPQEERKREPFLRSSPGHEAGLVFAKGRVIVKCSCGALVGKFDRDMSSAIEYAWFQHRDGEERWKKT